MAKSVAELLREAAAALELGQGAGLRQTASPSEPKVGVSEASAMSRDLNSPRMRNLTPPQQICLAVHQAPSSGRNPHRRVAKRHKIYLHPESPISLGFFPTPGAKEQQQHSVLKVMAGHEWEDWFEREEFIGQISDIRVQNLQDPCRTLNVNLSQELHPPPQSWLGT
ncbi:hypothetical protein NFI96_005486 [Prochilodus magdalenae]|nr:hypothetical protein NFI96_005486 [Prochilodus magdalenae]